jgi:hypothetical protein
VRACLRRIVKTGCHFLNDDAATKQMWLELRNLTAEGDRAAPMWTSSPRPATSSIGESRPLATDAP